MVDTIDLIIKNLKYLDVEYIKSIGIFVDCYAEINNKYKFYKSTYYYQLKDNKDIKNYGYHFKHKLIEFYYCKPGTSLKLVTKPSNLLNKKDICLSDKQQYKDIVLKIVRSILPNHEIYMDLNRIDLKVDIPMSNENKLKEYVRLLDKHDSKYMYTKRKIKYDSSTYLSNKYGQYTFNFYDKEQERIDKNYLVGAKQFKNILRLEVQLRPAKLKAETTRNNPTEPILDNYYCKDGMEKFYFDIISKYFYEPADHYSKRRAKSIINKSNLSKNWKEKLKRFLDKVEKYKGVKNTWQKGYCSRTTAVNYVEKLIELGVNPITIDNKSEFKHLDNLVKLARDKARNDYYK